MLCEKPLALNAADAEALVTEARRRGVFFMEAMWMRCNPTIRAVQDMVATGVIGDVTAVSADFGFVPDKPPEHRVFNPSLGASALLDIGVYPLTFASLFLGEPDAIVSTGTLSDRGIDLSCASLLCYAGGATAAVSSTMLAVTPEPRVVPGTLGNIELPRRFHSPSEYTVTSRPTPARSHDVCRRRPRQGLRARDRGGAPLPPRRPDGIDARAPGRHGGPDATDGPDTRARSGLPSPGRPLVMSPRV